MCGISIIVPVKDITSKHFLQFNNIIRHRGPDDEGYLLWSTSGQVQLFGGNDTPEETYIKGGLKGNISAFPEQSFQLGMAQRRLSIIDVSPAGHNPMPYLNQRYWIVYNGEIYNYLELRVELEQHGCTFDTHTDTEVILAAYATWGTSCLHRFVGMWAFAIFDTAEETLFVTRDRYGIKPLYYWISPAGSLCFASEIKQFTTLPGWVSEPNYHQISDYAVYSITDHNEETMFKGVRHLPSGCFYHEKIGGRSFNVGQRIPFNRWYKPVQQTFEGSYEEAVAQFKACFLDALTIHLRADVPIGTALSGGLDSSSIAGVINHLLKSTGDNNLQNTFSSCSKYAEFDERKWMDQVVAFLGVKAHYIYPTVEDVLSQTSKMVWHQDEPYTSQSALLANKVFEEAAKNNIKVLINGQGADEYIGGYGQFSMPYLSELLLTGHWSQLRKDIDVFDNRGGKAHFSDVLKYAVYYHLPKHIRRLLSNNLGYAGLISKLLDAKRLNGPHPYESIPYDLKTVTGTSNHFLFHSSLPKYLRWEDRNSMSHSIEARVPFLDHRLVEFTQSLPLPYLQHKGIRKSIQRDALSDFMPEAVKNRPDKMGYETPEKKWLTKEAPDAFRKKMAEAVEKTNGFVQPEAIKYIDRVIDGQARFDYTYWKLIMLGEWSQQFKVKF